jgi:phosphatidate phosphatase APP1
VISDIDDTIKVSVVRDRVEMLRNTFLRPFRAVNGMSALYARWAANGAVFHYVSSSPWQLYAPLERFMDEAGFPAGGIHLRWLLKRGEKYDLTASSMTHKLTTIAALLALHPRRSFVLVGDSGEKDPEIYGEIARKNPGRITRILIRKAPLADESAARYEAAFAGLPATLWQVFAEPAR